MTDLQTRFQRSLDGLMAPDLRPGIERRVSDARQDSGHGFREPPNRDSLRRLAAAVTAFVVFAAAGIFAWRAFDGSGGTAPSEPSNISAVPLTKAGVADTIRIGRGTAVTYGEGSVWVSLLPVDGESKILRIDPETDEVVATIQTPVVPSWEVGGGGLVVADGSVWSAGSVGASGGRIVRIDPSSNSVVETIKVPQGTVAGVAVNGDGIWALITGNAGAPEVVRIDRSTGQIVATIPLSGGYGRFIFAGEGWVLAAVTQPPAGGAAGGTLVHIDPATGKAGAVFDLGTYPSVAEGEGVVWAATGSGLVQIDPLSAQPIGHEATVGCTGDALAVGMDGVWCFDPARDRAPIRINPDTGTVDVTLALGAKTGGLALASSPGSVWVIDGADLIRIDLVGPLTRVVPVPDLIGLSFDEARAQIEAVRLTLGDVQVVTGTYIHEAVVEQDPSPGTFVDAGTTIDLVTGPSGAG